MVRRAAAVVTAMALLAIAVGCAAESMDRGGGLTPPLTVELTPSPSWHPVGPAVKTGIVVGDAELVIYFWAGGDGTGTPTLTGGWLDARTSAVLVRPRDADGVEVTVRGGGTAYGYSDSPFIGIHQVAFVGHPLIEWGAIRGRPARIVIESDGQATAASFTRWPHDEDVTIFWLQRSGDPMPEDTPIGDGAVRPLPPEYYPLVTAYDDAGEIIDSQRIRGTGGGPHIV